MKYDPSDTGLRFLHGKEFVKVIMGPVGGGKSTVALMTLWYIASVLQQPFNGVRRTKFIILRNTMAQLKSTVKPLIDQWFADRGMGTWRLSENVFEIKLRLPDNTVMHSEFCMMAADTPEDVRRLLSMECSAAWIEECREVVKEVVEGLMGRVARFPNRANGGVTYPCVLCSTNPPPMDTYWHKQISNPPNNWGVYIQPPALLDDGSLNKDAENLEHLHPAYYENLVEGKTDDWINVYLKNKFGAGGFGKPVHAGVFKRDFHVKHGLMPIFQTMRKLIVGSDNGLTAAAVLGQEDARGRINVLREAYVPEGQTMGYDRFLDNILTPQIRELRFSPDNVLFVVDPACFQRSQANEVTIAQVIASRGYAVVRASNTNSMERRISAVEGLMAKQVDGEALLRIDDSCSHLISALDWGYRNKKQSNDQAVPVIDKNHFSHIAESLQYFSLYFNHAVGGVEIKPKAREVKRSQFAYT